MLLINLLVPVPLFKCMTLTSMKTTLELNGISKAFPGVRALTNVSFKIKGGQVHALVGENGAGKSTLMNILSGNLQADEGSIVLDEERVSIPSPRSASDLGIAIVHQERSLVENLSVAENIFPEKQPRNFLGLIDYTQLHRAAQELLTRLQINHIQTRTLVTRLSSGQKQMIEIAKALATPCKILILDEPTASISYHEVTILFNIIKDLKKSGVAIIYISHRMHEIKEISDVTSVLKDGKYQGTVDTQTTSIDQIINIMVGRDIIALPYSNYRTSEITLDVQNLTGKQFRNINFQVYKGEILGFAGLIGSGRTEMAKTIFGDVPAISGTVSMNEIRINPSKPLHAILAGIAYIPEERISQGIFPEMSVEDNIVVSKQGAKWRNGEANKLIAEKYVTQLKIKTPSLSQQMVKLSGGNQQKVILARWLSMMPDLLIIDEPTHGVDVGSKFEIYEMIRSLASQGMSIILISSELPELLLLSDRIAVMRNGEIKTVIERTEASEELIMQYASG
jgi:ribose transport system ATP-binding protein